MKKFLMFLAASAMLINFSACSKDDDGDGDGGGNGDAKENHCKIGSTTYDLNFADVYFDTAGENEEFVLYDIFLYEETNPYDENGDWDPEDFFVNLFYLYADSSVATEGQLYSGTYNYSAEIGYKTHSGGSHYEIEEEEIINFGQRYVPESRLAVKVNHVSGNVYEIEWSGGVDENGNAVSGYYKGPVVEGALDL